MTPMIELIGAIILLAAATITLIDTISQKPKATKKLRCIIPFLPIAAVIMASVCLIFFHSLHSALYFLSAAVVLSTFIYLLQKVPASRIETCTLIVLYFALAMCIVFYWIMRVANLLDKMTTIH